MNLPAQLERIAGGRPKPALVAAVAEGLADYGPRFGLDLYARQAHFVAQVAHESDRFLANEEYASGAAYEGRRDLGNTQPGDGKRYKGRGPIQLTGRANYRSFTAWCRRHLGEGSPDFEAQPDKVTEAPWNFLAAVAYWDAFNPTGKSLNVYADANNIEAVTRKINGGLNGYAERCELYTRAALVFLGYELKAGVVAQFQRDAGLTGDDVDDVAGQKTRQLLHERLVALGRREPEPSRLPPSQPSPARGEGESPPPSLARIIIDLILRILRSFK